MSDRNYLSISEVLGLLKDEFPDITISKIRFLESQGLIAPERTPSGYRKFFDADVERLRWILRQQKDKFLPLRVIKGRLEGTVDADGNPIPEGASAPDPVTAEAGSDDSAGDPGGDESAELPRPEGKHLRPAGSSTPPDGNVAPPVPVAAAGVVDATVPMSKADLPPVTAPGQAAVDAAGAELSADEPSADEPTEDDRAEPDEAPAADAGKGAEDRPVPESAGAAEAHDGAEARKGVTDAAAGTGSIRRPPGAGGPAPDGGARKAHKPFPESLRRAAASDAAHLEVAEDAEMTAEELRTAAGIDRAELGELEKFDLVKPVEGPAGSVYKGIDLRIARLAVAFRQYGIEPRHLRSWRNAADREAGLFEQAVTPSLRQRNPQAQEQARNSLRELTRLSDDLHDLLLQAALSRYLR